MVFWDRAAQGGRKSFRREELDDSFIIKVSNQVFIHYLEMVSRDLDIREDDRRI